MPPVRVKGTGNKTATLPYLICYLEATLIPTQQTPSAHPNNPDTFADVSSGESGCQTVPKSLDFSGSPKDELAKSVCEAGLLSESVPHSLEAGNGAGIDSKLAIEPSSSQCEGGEVVKSNAAPCEVHKDASQAPNHFLHEAAAPVTEEPSWCVREVENSSTTHEKAGGSEGEEAPGNQTEHEKGRGSEAPQDQNGQSAETAIDLVAKGIFDHDGLVAAGIKGRELARYRREAGQAKRRLQQEAEVAARAALVQEGAETWQKAFEALHERVFGPERDLDEFTLLRSEPESVEEIQMMQDRKLIPSHSFEFIRAILEDGTKDPNKTLGILSRFQTSAAKLFNKPVTLVTPEESAKLGCWYLGQHEAKRPNASKRWPGLVEYYHRKMDEHDPFYLPDGRVNRKILPANFGVIDLKGIGEVVVWADFAQAEQKIQDAWARSRWERTMASEIDQRANTNKFDSTGSAGTIGRILSWLQFLFKKGLEARRASEEEDDYGFPTVEEKPFTGDTIVLASETPEDGDQFYLTIHHARIFNNIFPPYRVRIAPNRDTLIDGWLMEQIRQRILSLPGFNRRSYQLQLDNARQRQENEYE